MLSLLRTGINLIDVSLSLVSSRCAIQNKPSLSAMRAVDKYFYKKKSFRRNPVFLAKMLLN